MTNIELTNIEDGIFVFDQHGKLKFCSDYCDTILPGLNSILDSNSYLKDVYTAIVSLGFRISVFEGIINIEDGPTDAGWSEFKNVPSDVEFTSDDGHVLRWTTRRYGDDEIFATLSDHTWISRRIVHVAQLAKMYSIAEMSGQIGHDLNNFLTIIQGNLELLETLVSDDEKLSRWVAAASDATERGSDMAKNMLYLGRRRPARRRDVATTDAILETVEKIQNQDDNSVQIDMLIPLDLYDIRVDETHFKMVLVHLFLNALEACANRGTISILAENFVVEGKISGGDDDQDETVDEEENSYVRIIVDDTGVGMTANVSNRAF